MDYIQRQRTNLVRPNSAEIRPPASPPSAEASNRQLAHADIARIGVVLEQYPELIPSTQSFLDTMLAPECHR
jgi:hypothetical protein